MFPFWELAIAPVLTAAEAKRVVEIGALRGDNTRQIIEHLGPGSVLHVVDPSPGFDPSEHERRFGGRYVFHRALSLDALPAIGPVDAALIDGDHNWYTVVNELRLVRQSAEDAGEPLPVLILHDVGWPYGRRDLYYDPETIPPEHRQPHRRAGMRLGRSDLVERGGMSAGHWNAEREGGPRNGVMTALEDFLAEYGRPVRTVVLPLYFGLAVVVDEERLARQPALARALDHLESPETKDALIELGEELRVRSVAHNHTQIGERDQRIERLTRRYLDRTISSILNEPRLEAEIAMRHLLDTAVHGGALNDGLLADPVRRSAVAFEKLRARRRTGAGVDPEAADDRSDLSLSSLGRLGLEALDQAATAARRSGPGHLVVCGAGRGGSALLLRAHLDAHDDVDRHVWIADHFRGYDGTALNRTRDAFHRFDLLDDRVHFLQGELSATLPDAPVGEVAMLVIGPVTGPEARAALDHVYPRLRRDATVVVEDVSDPAVRDAVEAFRAAHAVTDAQVRFGSSGTTWVTASPVTTTGVDPVRAPRGAARAPLAEPVSDPLDLSMVVVFYNMRREAARTLESLSRAYQRGIDDLRYEVVVVENGSAPEERLGEAFVTGFGPEFRYLDLGAEADPSPAVALNRGIAASRGSAVGLMIDGAHVLSPGVLRYAVTGLEAYAPAVVATQAWYVGPGQQGEAMRSGYDQAFEDELFKKISWPSDGYRLFEISHLIGDRDWLEGLWESNCLFATRSQIQQVGGFDEGFAMAGGGYTNLDLYERLGSSPDIEIVTILGEASFHQVHGGTTTNLTDPMERRTRVHSYTEHYADLRGRPFIGPEKPLRFVGAFETNDAKRTRARRMTATAFDVDRDLEGPDGPLGPPRPVPEDQRDRFIDAYWRSHAWRNTAWLGRPVQNAATDLITYQEILTELRPDWIIETGTRDGGRASFLASICDLLGHGQVVSVDRPTDVERPTHPRITYVAGAAQLPETVARVRDIVGPEPNGLVILGTRGRRNRTRDEFDAYAPMVAVGSYAIVEHTMLNGWPVDGSFGRGPFEAVRGILATRGDFVVDTEREKHALTFNPFGFLRRIS